MPETSPKLGRYEWINAFADEWMRLAEGRADMEEILNAGETLFRVNGEQTPEEIAGKHFDSYPEPEDRVRDPEGEFTALAAELGIIKDGDKLGQVQIDFAYGVVDLCATIGDAYGDKAYGNAGDHIRSIYGSV